MNREKFIVYILDDDTDDLEILSEAFETAGCVSQVRCFTSGSELFDSIASKQAEIPDIIILDQYVSLTDGFDLPERIRCVKRFDRITLAIYSSALQPARVEQLLKQGVDVCRQKGNTLQELEIDVASFCKAIESKQKQ